MIYDCFTFFNELDLLEIRLHTLKDVVDKFVIAEATRTHTGKPKNLVFAENRMRFSEFEAKIIYIRVDDLLSEEEVAKDIYNLPWVNENRQRNALIKGLVNAGDNDVVMISDVDEIPNPEFVLKAESLLAKSVKSVRFSMAIFNFYLNFRDYSNLNWLLGTIAVRYSSLLSMEFFAEISFDRYTQKSENIGPTVQQLRFLKPEAILDNAGWHFSYLGGINMIMQKLAAFSHSEYGSVPIEIVQKRLENGHDLFGRFGRFFGVEIDSFFPEYIVSNVKKYAHLIFPINEEYLKKTKDARSRALVYGKIYRFCANLIPSCMGQIVMRTRDAILKILRLI